MERAISNEIYKAILIAAVALIIILLVLKSLGIEFPIISSLPGILKPFGA